MPAQNYDPDNLQDFDTSFTEEISSTQYAKFILLLSMPWDTFGTFILRYFRLSVDYMNSHGITHGATQGFMINIAAMHPVITLTCIAGVAVITAFACMYFYFDESYKTQLKKQEAKNTHEIIQDALKKEQKGDETNNNPMQTTTILSDDIAIKASIKAFSEKSLDEKNRILTLVLKKRESEFSQLINKESSFVEKDGVTRLIIKPKPSITSILSSHWMMLTLAVVMYWVLWITVAPLTGTLGVGVIGLSPFIGFGLPLAAGLGFLAIRAKHFRDHRKEDALPNLDEKILKDNLQIACSEEQEQDTDLSPLEPTKNKYFGARIFSEFMIKAVNTHLIAQYALWFGSDMFPILAAGATLHALSWGAILLPLIVGGLYAYDKYKKIIKETPEDTDCVALENLKKALEETANKNRVALDNNLKRFPTLLYKTSMLTGKAIESDTNTFIQYFMTPAFVARLYTLGSTSPFIIFNIAHAAAWLTLPVTLGIIGTVGAAWASYRLFAVDQTFERAATLKDKIASLKEEIKIGDELIKAQQNSQTHSIKPTMVSPKPSPTSSITPPVILSSPVRASTSAANEVKSSWSFPNMFNKPIHFSPLSACCGGAGDAAEPSLRNGPP